MFVVSVQSGQLAMSTWTFTLQRTELLGAEKE
jgi:hypothetical protein